MANLNAFTCSRSHHTGLFTLLVLVARTVIVILNSDCLTVAVPAFIGCLGFKEARVPEKTFEV